MWIPSKYVKFQILNPFPQYIFSLKFEQRKINIQILEIGNF